MRMAAKPRCLIPDAHNTSSVSSCGDRYVLYDSYRNGKLEIWRVDADGSNGKKIIDADSQAGISECSPDGKWIFYSAKDTIYRMPIRRWRLCLARESSRRRRCTSGLPRRHAARLRLPGRPSGSHPKIATVPVAGGPTHVVSQTPLGTRGFVWSPSGKALQLGFLRNGASNIWEQPLSGGPPRQITNFTSDRITDFAWSRDGKQLFMTRGNATSDVILISNFR